MTTLIDLMMAGMIEKTVTPAATLPEMTEIIQPHTPGMTTEQLKAMISQVEPSMMEECCPEEFWKNEDKT